MGEAIDRLRKAAADDTVALAGSVVVSGYERTSSTGKAVHVSSYTRSPAKMANGALLKEFHALVTKFGGTSNRKGLPGGKEAAVRISDLSSEIHRRKAAGVWDKGDNYVPSAFDRLRIKRKPDSAPGPAWMRGRGRGTTTRSYGIAAF